MRSAMNSQRPVLLPYWRGIITMGVCLTVLMVCVAASNDIVRARQSALLANDRALASMAAALAEHAAQSLHGIDAVLRHSANWDADPQHPPGTTRRGGAAFLGQRIEGLPSIRRLEIHDAGGRRIASSAAPAQPPSSVAPDRLAELAGLDWFQQLRRARAVAGDHLVMHAVPPADGAATSPGFTVALRIDDADGAFRGVALALVDAAYFRRFYASLGLGRGTQIELQHSDGHPLLDFSDGRRQAPALHARAVYRIVPGFPLQIRLSRDEAVVLADWRITSIQIILRSGAILIFVVLLAYGLVRQVRRREDANAQLVASDQLWQPVFDNTPVGIVVLPPGGNFLAANPAFQRMVGYSMAELRERKLADIAEADDLAATELRTDALLHGDLASVRSAQRLLHRDGHMVWAEISMTRVFAPQQATQHTVWHLDGVLIVTVEDMTARRQAEQERLASEQQTRQAQKMEALGTFAGGIAHDFNNILGAILGFGERALHGLPAGLPERRHVEQVMSAGHRARLLVRRILAFSRSEMTLRVPFRLAPVVDEVIELVRAGLPPTVRLQLDIGAPQASLNGDATHLHQVLMNLCSNALLAMPDGGTLSVSLATEQRHGPAALSHGALVAGLYARLTVSDSGVGMAPALLESIFNPFFTTRAAGQGTGLGLALVDGIVREYGGAMDIDSRPGAGTRFAVYLPLPGALDVAGLADRSGAPQGRGQTILLVDDETALVDLNEEVLAGLGYEAVGFSSSEAAWLAFRAAPQRFDAVVTDFRMDGLSGLELAGRIRALRPELPVILCSGYGSVALERDAHAAGVYTLLQKPLQEADLAQALRRLLPA